MKKFLICLSLLFLCSCSSVHRSFMEPPEIIDAGDSQYQLPQTRQFTGIPSLAISPAGRLWVTWYAGKTPDEDQNNYIVLSTSGDDGQTWKEVFIIDPDGEGPVRAFDPELWLSPDGRLWMFWAQHVRSEENPACPVAGVWAMVNDRPDEPDSKWSDPRRLTNGVMMCKPTVLSCGDWLLPVSLWKTMDNSALAVCSTDQGKTFEVLGGCNVPVEQRTFDEHMFVQRNDGNIWMLVRIKDGIGESFSSDGGRTWGLLETSKIQHPSARFFIRRLNSGNLLLVKHGDINKRTGRSHLMAFISKDDGQTWQGGLLLDERKGVSYPDGQQADDGVIYITYDYSRRDHQKILMSCFTEQDVLEGEDVTGKVRLRVSVN